MHDLPGPEPPSAAPAQHSDTTAVVLGAGGVAGWSFHVGVADALAEVNLDLPANGRVVGVSAGAAIAAAVMAGAHRDEVMHHIVTPPSPEERERAMAAVKGKRRSPWRLLRPTAPGLVRRVLPGPDREPGLAIAGMLPEGVFPTTPLRRFPAVHDADWPPELLVPAVRLPSGERVAFGRESGVSLADAVEASQAVPMLFVPKEIDGYRYIDGATLSSTHADLARAPGIQHAIIAAPMVRPGRGLWRSRARAALGKEVRDLTSAGLRTTVITPGDDCEGLFSRIRSRDTEAAHRLRAWARSATLEAMSNSSHPQ